MPSSALSCRPGVGFICNCACLSPRAVSLACRSPLARSVGRIRLLTPLAPLCPSCCVARVPAGGVQHFRIRNPLVQGHGSWCRGPAPLPTAELAWRLWLTVGWVVKKFKTPRTEAKGQGGSGKASGIMTAKQDTWALMMDQVASGLIVPATCFLPHPCITVSVDIWPTAVLLSKVHNMQSVVLT